MTTHDDDDLILTHVERLVGSLANGQRQLVLTAIRENSAGVLALASRLSTSSAARSVVAVFVTSIQRGEHRQERTPPAGPRRIPSTAPPPLTAPQIDRNRRLARLMRRTHRLRASSAIATAMAGLTGAQALDAAEQLLDELERATPAISSALSTVPTEAP